MTPDTTSAVWVPVCCGRVMRCNMFRLPDGGAYAALVCTICNKNITLEQEPLAADNYGEGSNVLSLLGSPKPPPTDRRKSARDVSLDEPTL